MQMITHLLYQRVPPPLGTLTAAVPVDVATSQKPQGILRAEMGLKTPVVKFTKILTPLTTGETTILADLRFRPPELEVGR